MMFKNRQSANPLKNYLQIVYNLKRIDAFLKTTLSAEFIICFTVQQKGISFSMKWP